jgi:AAA15 family ATPase/GTPase
MFFIYRLAPFYFSTSTPVSSLFFFVSFTHTGCQHSNEEVAYIKQEVNIKRKGSKLVILCNGKLLKRITDKFTKNVKKTMDQ